MEGKRKAGLITMLCLLGVGFACGGHGFADGGVQFGAQNVSLEVKAQFMQATHEGDYDLAMELHDEYGIGGMRFEQSTEEMFGLMAQIFEAQKLGDWTGAVELQEQMAGLARGAMQGFAPGNGMPEMGHGAMRPQMNGTNEECREAMQGEEAAGLMEQIREARESGSVDEVAELEGELAELIPEECMEMPKRDRGKWHQMRGLGQ